MKYKILIKKNGNILYDGKAIDLPIKKDVLKNKSIEMFADEDPCIIHQTFVVETLIDELISLYKKRLDEQIILSKDMKEIKFVDLGDLDQAIMVLKRR